MSKVFEFLQEKKSKIYRSTIKTFRLKQKGVLFEPLQSLVVLQPYLLDIKQILKKQYRSSLPKRSSVFTFLSQRILWEIYNTASKQNKRDEKELTVFPEMLPFSPVDEFFSNLLE